MNNSRSDLLNWSLLAAGVAFFVTALAMIFFYVPTEASMGVVQRIFYFHVPVAWISLLSYTILFIASIMYLVKKDRKWDAAAISAAEIGFLFTAAFLATGSIWAKPAWDVWWTWSPRLTSALVLFFIYIAYMMVRSYGQSHDQKARFGAIVAIIGFFDIPIVILSISLWRTQHPSALVFEGGLEPSMLLTLMICLLAFSVLFILIFILAVRINYSRMKVKELIIEAEFNKR